MRRNDKKKQLWDIIQEYKFKKGKLTENDMKIARLMSPKIMMRSYANWCQHCGVCELEDN